MTTVYRIEHLEENLGWVELTYPVGLKYPKEWLEYGTANITPEWEVKTVKEMGPLREYLKGECRARLGLFGVFTLEVAQNLLNGFQQANLGKTFRVVALEVGERKQL